IHDLMDERRPMERYLYEEFLKQRNFGIICRYDISRGLTFLEKAMEGEFVRVTDLSARDRFASPPSKIFPYIDTALKSTKMAVFIDHAEKIIPSSDVSGLNMEERSSLIWLCEWSTNSRISANGSVVCLLSENLESVNRELISSSYKVEPVLVNLPNQEERESYIKFLLSGESAKSKLSMREFSQLSSGLSRKAIKDIKLRAEAEGVPISFEFIKEKKQSVLQKEYGDVLEFIYPEIGFENIAGMDKAKSYLLRNVVEPIKKGDLRRVPMGVMLCGPSGTGKTMLVNALAKTSGFNCVKIDMSRILGQYVGVSEKNFKKCLLGAQSQQPVIIFVDEIDTAFSRGDKGDSGVSRNIFSEFLQFTSNTRNRGKIIFIAATNRPDLLDPALKRAGRFDKKIPILLPGEPERAEMFGIMIKKYRFKTDVTDFARMAASTDSYTGAEIETVVRKAYELACEAPSGKGLLTEGILMSAIDKCRPNTQQIEFMTEMAIGECDDIDLL
ncbi:MAG: ATP-binding protein, partial [Oscillospiraceae bacterium]|nr:ATP-binding protein [Oscillospiraceae bacterium]